MAQAIIHIIQCDRLEYVTVHAEIQLMDKIKYFELRTDAYLKTS